MGKFREFGKRFTDLHTPKNCWRQAIKKRQKVLMFSKTVGILLLTVWLYYRSVWPLILLWPIGVWYYRNLEKECVEKKKSEFLVQFKEAVQSMAASLHSGYSVENAVKETQKEMLLMYPKDEMICKELNFMVQQIYISEYPRSRYLKILRKGFGLRMFAILPMYLRRQSAAEEI